MIWTRENIGTASPFQQTQIDHVRARALFSLQDAAALINSMRILSYIASFTTWRENRENRSDLAASPAPEPDFAMIVTEDKYGNPVGDTSTERVCPVIVYIPPKKPDLIEGLIGKRLYPGNDVFFDIQRGDVTPNLKRIKGRSADNPPVEGEFEKHAYIQSSPGAHEIPGVFIKVA